MNKFILSCLATASILCLANCTTVDEDDDDDGDLRYRQGSTTTTTTEETMVRTPVSSTVETQTITRPY